MSLTTVCTSKSSQIDCIDFSHSHYIRLTQQTLTESIVYVANLACYANSEFIENNQLTLVLHTSNYRQILEIFNVTTLSLLPWWVYVQIEKWLTSRAVTQHHLHTVLFWSLRQRKQPRKWRRLRRLRRPSVSTTSLLHALWIFWYIFSCGGKIDNCFSKLTQK